VGKGKGDISSTYYVLSRCPEAMEPTLENCIPSRIGRRRCGHSATALYSTNWHIPRCPCNAPGVQHRLKHFLFPGPITPRSARNMPLFRIFSIVEGVLGCPFGVLSQDSPLFFLGEGKAHATGRDYDEYYVQHIIRN
jgi:hypothetical protein